MKYKLSQLVRTKLSDRSDEKALSTFERETIAKIQEVLPAKIDTISGVSSLQWIHLNTTSSITNNVLITISSDLETHKTKIVVQSPYDSFRRTSYRKFTDNLKKRLEWLNGRNNLIMEM